MEKKHQKFQKIFEPASIGKLNLKNRIIMAPMGTRLSSEMGSVTQQQIDYYVERAQGGVGTIIVECTAVDYPQGTGTLKNLSIHDNSYIGGHNELVEAIQFFGCRVFCQIYHVGRNARPANVHGLQPVAPSAIPCQFFNVLPRELTAKETEDIVHRFVQAAVRVKTAGYDGVEIHGSHGYLIGQFMSAKSNHRQDRYGGPLRQRMSFPREIVQGIRRELGKDFPVIFRLSGDEFIDGGMDLEESREAAKILEEAGVDALHVSAGVYDSMAAMIEPMSYPQGWKIYLAAEIKKAVKIPVIGVGVIRTPEFAEEILREGKVDFVALGRALLADPYWPQKVRAGRQKEIIPCISCNNGCIGGRIFKGLHIRCASNPLTGRERLKSKLLPAKRKKKVLIVGGGPAGIMAAVTADARGHEVTLYETAKQLGGQLRLAEKPPGKDKVAWLLQYLLDEVKRRGIKVRLGQPATKKNALQGKPDAVILATGAIPVTPDLPGVGKSSSAWEVLEGKKKIKDKVVLIVGGGPAGCETALYLATGNNKITILEMLGEIARDMEPINRMDHISKIQKSKIDILLHGKLERIEDDGVIWSDPAGQEKMIKADAVVLSLGVVPQNGLAADLKGEINEMYVIGDCQKPRKIIDAIHEGFEAALRL